MPVPKANALSTGVLSVLTKFIQKVIVHVLFPKRDANIGRLQETIKKYSKNRLSGKIFFNFIQI